MWQVGTIVISISRPEPSAYRTAQAIWQILSKKDIEDGNLHDLLPMVRALKILDVDGKPQHEAARHKI